LRVSLGSFVAGRSRQDVALVTCAEVERWLAGSGWSARTRRGYLGDVRALFNWAVRRGLLVRSPAAGIETPGPGLQSPPAIHSPAQVHQVLRLAMGGGSDLARLVAVGYFSGLRSAELLRLREVDFLRDRGFVEVTAANAKTRRRRLVRIGPALAAWLELPGAFPVPDATRRLRALRAAARRAGVPWPRNVLRHSWCSYHLARGANAAATALEAGHSETMLFAHYRELATPEVAAAFWAIRPD
jgi:integrase